MLFSLSLHQLLTSQEPAVRRLHSELCALASDASSFHRCYWEQFKLQPFFIQGVLQPMPIIHKGKTKNERQEGAF